MLGGVDSWRSQSRIQAGYGTSAKMNTLFRCLAIGSASLFFGCSGDPNEKANELYVQAVQLVESAKQAGSYSAALPLYEQAGDRVERVASQYSGSNIAVSLVSGQTKISNLTLSEFQELEDLLKRLVKAEQDPFSCALVVAETIREKNERASALWTVADGLAQAGQFPQALNVADSITEENWKAGAFSAIAGRLVEAGQFSQALDVADSITEEGAKAFALAVIAGGFAKAEQNEQTETILPQALDVANTITEEGAKVRALAGIANGLAKAGQFPQALDVANTIAEEETKAWTLG